ncbi:MobF family relaxase [Arthrobacter sp. ZGTC212]|uniref:MobF family relaxase n=2 Tax=unclassified Arthrobacter TaxID=235627 RepID=UPI000CE48E32|nr:MobF family relaxase [Arthrobacter sp. ZGTC212]
MMTVHKLSAGDGYAYYTSEVASADELRAGDRELGDYYTVEGMPPGRWAGHSMELLGVSGEVTGEQMAALFGEGLHPDAARLMADGATEKEVRLGQKYHRYTDADTELTRRLEEEHARVRRLTGSDPDKAKMHEIRGRVAGQLFREKHGRDARDNRELARFATAQTTPRQQTVAGYDLVFSPSKSVSLLWALGGEEARKAIEAAHHEAIAETITFLEKNALYTRRGKNGVRQIDVEGGLVATQFRHYDSRNGDPQLHDHVVIANKVLGADGKWSSIDGRTLYKMNVAASETYNSKVMEKVCAELGVAVVARKSGGNEPIYELAGIDLDAIHHASSRRTDIAGAIRRLEAEFTDKHGYVPSEKQKIALAQQATLETRPAKKDARKLSDLVHEWQKEYSSDLGMPVGNNLLERIRQASRRAAAPVDMHAVDVHEHARLIVHELSTKRATWGRNHVLAQVHRHLKESFPSKTMPDELVEKITRAATATHSLSVTSTAVPFRLREFARADGSSQFRQAESTLFTSREVLQTEHKVLAAAQLTVIPAVSAERFSKVLEKHLKQGQTLSEGQIELARSFTTGEKLLALGIGPAGAGKTTSLALAADAARAGGGHIIGLAPTAAAAAVMSTDLGADATTIDSFLASHRVEDSQSVGPRLRTGDVIIVDEAGMVTTTKLAEVVSVAARHGAVVRAIGDDRQLGAIGSGGALRLLDHQVGAVRLERVHRFRTEGEAEASLALREAPASGADAPWQWYMDNKRIVAGDSDTMTDAALRAWMADTAAGKNSLLIAGDNATVTDLNAYAQAARIATGELGRITENTPSVVLRDGLRAYAGDTVVTRKNDRSLQLNRGKDFVKNNDVWTVEKITTATAQQGAEDRPGNELVTLRHSGHNGRITLDAGYLQDHGQLGYAATVHRAQGTTVDTAHAILSERNDRAAAYVAATRGRLTNRLYIALEDGQERDDVLSAIAGAYDRNLSAHETVRTEAIQSGDLEKLATVYGEVEAAAWTAKTRTIAAEVMGTRTAATFTSREAWGAVAAHLRTAEQAGLDPAKILAQAAEIKDPGATDPGELPGFENAIDPAAVLAYRVEHRIESASRLVQNADSRPLGSLSDEHLAGLAKRASVSGFDTKATGQDMQWTTLPFATVPTQVLKDARADTVRRITDRGISGGLVPESMKDQWMVEAMGKELHRRTGLAPTQAAIERATRGEDPRSAHEINVSEAITYERRLRQVAGPTHPHTLPGGPGKGISEDLAPSGLIQDPLVPPTYRTELERLRAHLSHRVAIRGAQLAEEVPVWTKNLGPVPSHKAKATEWHQVAAETEAYRSRYNIGNQEQALIPPQYADDPAAKRLIARATALHKHSKLTTAPPQTAEQIRQGADEARIAERVTTAPAPAEQVIDRLRGERAHSGDKLPQPQQREAAVVDAIQAADAATEGGTAGAIARAVAKHRSTQQASDQPSAPAPGASPGVLQKETKVSETQQPPARAAEPGSRWGRKQAEAIQRRKAAAAELQARKADSSKADATAAARRADQIKRDGGRSL